MGIPSPTPNPAPQPVPGSRLALPDAPVSLLPPRLPPGFRRLLTSLDDSFAVVVGGASWSSPCWRPRPAVTLRADCLPGKCKPTGNGGTWVSITPVSSLLCRPCTLFSAFLSCSLDVQLRVPLKTTEISQAVSKATLIC